jgi:hypothetical protein
VTPPRLRPELRRRSDGERGAIVLEPNPTIGSESDGRAATPSHSSVLTKSNCSQRSWYRGTTDLGRCRYPTTLVGQSRAEGVSLRGLATGGSRAYRPHCLLSRAVRGAPTSSLLPTPEGRSSYGTVKPVAADAAPANFARASLNRTTRGTDVGCRGLAIRAGLQLEQLSVESARGHQAVVVADF